MCLDHSLALVLDASCPTSKNLPNCTAKRPLAKTRDFHPAHGCASDDAFTIPDRRNFLLSVRLVALIDSPGL